MAAKGVGAGAAEALEQLVWFLWATAIERPFYFLLAFVVPLLTTGIFAVSSLYIISALPSHQC